MNKQLVLISSPDAVAHYASLANGWDVYFSNGKLPPEAAQYSDGLAISTDANWCQQQCAMLVALNLGRIRWNTADLSQCTNFKEAVAALKASGFHDFPSSAPQPEAPSVASPVPESAKAAAAEPLEPARTAQDDAILYFHAQIPPEGAETTVQPLRKRTRPKLAIDNGNLARAPDPDDEPLPASLSEDALAEHFVGTRGERWRYVPEWGIWLEWRGDGWHRDELSKVAHECKEITRECLQWAEARTLTPDGKRKISSKRMAWNVRDMAEVHPKISIHAAELDADPMLLGVPGGVVCLKTGKFLEADPEQYITRRTSIAPEPGPHPLFDRVLERAENGHDGMRSYLLRALGYACLTGLTNEEVFFCLVGNGGAGKGSLTKALQAIMGDYADTIAIEALLETKHQRHSQEIAKLEGVRIVFSNEPDDGCRFNSGQIKALTSSEPVTAHRMRMDDHTYTPTHKLLLSMNSMPGLKSVSDGAMKRRLHIIQYAEPISEEKRDTTLKERMVAEYPAILHTLITGCVDWQDCGGLGKPESVIASVDDYLENEDTFAEFVETNIERVMRGTERSSEVFHRYLEWARTEGEKYPMGQKRFIAAMRQKGFELGRSAAGKILKGLKLFPAPPAQPGHSYQDRD